MSTGTFVLGADTAWIENDAGGQPGGQAIAALNGSQVFVADSMQEGTILDVGPGQLAAYSSKSPEKEGDNEDAAAVISLPPDRVVLAVADGVGGKPQGRDAARKAIQTLVRSIEERAAARGELRDGILDGFERANEAVLAFGVGAGTTLAVVEVQQSFCRSYHVGDSAALLVGQRGRVKHYTVAHSPTGYAVEAGMLGEDEALLHEERHLVSNVLGTREMKIEIGPVVPLAARDTLVVASDGLFDNLRLQTIIDTVRKGPLPEIAVQLLRLCQSRMQGKGQTGKPDDLTFLVYRGQETRAGTGT